MKNIGVMLAVLCMVGCAGQGTGGEVVGTTASLTDGGAPGPGPGGGRPASFSQNYQFRGEAADASFYGAGADGCSYYQAAIYGGENVSHMLRGAPVSSAYSYAYVNGYNWCTGGNFYGWGWTESASVDGLNGANLSVPVTVSSVTCGWVECPPDSADPRCAPCDPSVDPRCWVPPPPPCDPATDPSCCDPRDPMCVPPPPPPPPPPPGYMDCRYTEQTGNLVAAIVGVGDVSRGISMSNYSSGPYRSVSRNNGSQRQATATGSLMIDGRDFLAGATGWGSLNHNTTSSHTFYRY